MKILQKGNDIYIFIMNTSKSLPYIYKETNHGLLECNLVCC